MMDIVCRREPPNRQDGFGDQIIDYSMMRPFEGWKEEVLLSCLDSALCSEPINLEISTLIFQELEIIKGDAARAKDMIRSSGGEVIPWLAGARHRVDTLWRAFKQSGKKPTDHNVYFVLLTKDRKTPTPWGLYIGQTSQTIEERLAEHFDDEAFTKSPKVNKRGWQLLYSLCSPIRPVTKVDSCRFEGLALDAFQEKLKYKKIKKLPIKRVQGAGPPEYRVAYQQIGKELEAYG